MTHTVLTQGQRCAAARNAKGLSQEALVRLVGCCTGTIERIEQDRTKTSPRAETLAAIERYCGVPPGSLGKTPTTK